jgi:hypothetical protein
MKKTISKCIRTGIVSITLLCSFLAFTPVMAHIKTDTSQFPDVKSSEARFDILVLVGLGIIPETTTFEPERKLSRFDLAVWAAMEAKLAPEGEKPDVNMLANAAKAKGLVMILEGNATYADINTLFFQDKHDASQAATVPTRAQAASYILAGLVSPEGASLLEKKGVAIGPVGKVSSVEEKTNPDGGTSFMITIGDKTMAVYTHGRVGNGPSDLAKWKDRIVRRSFIRKQGEISLWSYLESETVAGEVVAEPEHDHSSHKHEEEAAPVTSSAEKPEHEHAEHQHSK